MPLAVNHRLQLWHIGHFGTEMFLILTIVECALDVFSITASTILPSLLLLVEQLVCLISLPMYVGIYERHAHDGWYGTSATVCTNTFETASIFSFIPVQRIFAVGAYCRTEVSLSGIDETVFVSAPVPMRLSF